MVSVDFFTVATVDMRVLHTMLVLSHDRRRVLGFDVMENPTAAWAAGVLVRALVGRAGIKYLVRDRDPLYRREFQVALSQLSLEQLVTAPRSPWQNAYVERLIGSVRRECLDHVIVFHEDHLRKILTNYFEYYHAARTHLGLGKDAPIPRQVEGPERGKVIALPFVGGLHHRYTRRAA